MPVDVLAIRRSGKFAAEILVGKLYAELLVLDLALLKSSASLIMMSTHSGSAGDFGSAFELQCFLGPNETGGFYLDPPPHKRFAVTGDADIVGRINHTGNYPIAPAQALKSGDFTGYRFVIYVSESWVNGDLKKYGSFGAVVFNHDLLTEMMANERTVIPLHSKESSVSSRRLSQVAIKQLLITRGPPASINRFDIP